VTSPAYLTALEAGELQRKVQAAHDLLRRCCVCPRSCGVNRLEDELGFCGIGRRARIASAGPHFGEESPLVGFGGSGTIFFSSCNLKCIFCQNYEISHEMEGHDVSPEDLGRIMLGLQRAGCHNINFVTPSHVVPQILSGVQWAAERGLTLPLVYNTSAYDSVETLRILDGIIDIYMPDIKCLDRRLSAELLNAEDYPEVATNAIMEMHRQVGDLQIGEDGIAVRGLLVRHLVMPEDAANTREAMQFIAQRVSPDTYVNIMDQYRPVAGAKGHPLIGRTITTSEYKRAIQAAHDVGVTRLDRRVRFRAL